MDPLDQELYTNLLGQPHEKAQKIRFLKVKAQQGTDLEAKAAAEISQACLNKWIDSDETFRQHYCYANKDFAEGIIAEAWKQVKEGHEVDVWYKGAKVGTSRDRRMTVPLLKAMMVGFNPHINDRPSPKGELFETIKLVQEMIYNLGLAKQPQQLEGQVVEAEVVPIHEFLERYPDESSSNQPADRGNQADSSKRAGASRADSHAAPGDNQSTIPDPVECAGPADNPNPSE